MSDLTDEALDGLIESTRMNLDRLMAVKKARRLAAFDEAVKSNPWNLGDRVTTKFSGMNYPITKLTPSAVIVTTRAGSTERIPLRRVLVADPAKDRAMRAFRG